MYIYTLCFIKHDDRLLMLNRKYKPNMGLWNGLGGKIENSETPLECVIREVYEEANIKLECVRYTGSVTWQFNNNTTGMHVFMADLPTNLSYSTPFSIDEGILDWKDVDWVLDPNNSGVADNLKYFLPCMLSDGGIFEHEFSYDLDEKLISYNKLIINDLVKV